MEVFVVKSFYQHSKLLSGCVAVGFNSTTTHWWSIFVRFSISLIIIMFSPVFCGFSSSSSASKSCIILSLKRLSYHWRNYFIIEDIISSTMVLELMAESLHPVMAQWIQYKLGKQYLWNKVTLPWESDPRPTPIRGDVATIIVSVGLKKTHVAIHHHIQVR